MIFVTVGTHEQPFNRLIQKVDELKRDGVIKDDVIIQTGFSTYEPKYCQWSKLIPYQQMVKNVADSFIPYYDFISNCVTNVFEKTYDVAIDFYGYGSFVTAFLATKIQAKKKATWLHDEKLYWLKSVQKYLCKYDKVYGVSQAVVDAFCREHPHYKDKAAVFYNVIDGCF